MEGGPPTLHPRAFKGGGIRLDRTDERRSWVALERGMGLSSVAYDKVALLTPLGRTFVRSTH